MATNSFTQAMSAGAETRNALEGGGWSFLNRNRDRVVRGLGWFSVCLGVAELVAPRGLARFVGSRGKHDSIVQSYGLRELAAGVGILTTERPTKWLWARVAGDAVDLASLASVANGNRKGRGRAIASIASVAGVTALDVWCARKLTA